MQENTHLGYMILSHTMFVKEHLKNVGILTILIIYI